MFPHFGVIILVKLFHTESVVCLITVRFLIQTNADKNLIDFLFTIFIIVYTDVVFEIRKSKILVFRKAELERKYNLK